MWERDISIKRNTVSKIEEATPICLNNNFFYTFIKKTKRMKKLFSLILLLSFTIKAQEIKIGTQTWTTKNLDVTTYRNGDVIPEVVQDTTWEKLTTGAWCYYENKTAKGTTYGKLYNWYAVNDPRGLAPKGYHIPTDAEWTILTDSLGELAGTKMKSTSGWDNDGNGTNTSGFAGLPGGSRDFNGDFLTILTTGAGVYCNWWSSSEFDSNYAWSRSLFYFNGNVNRNYYYKQGGFSVRCLRD